MIEKTISNLEEKIKKNKSIKGDDKKQLIALLGVLKTEVSTLSKTDSDHAESVAGFTQTSAHEAMRKEKHEELLELSLKGLATSVEELESSHPKLVEAVNRISQMLSNMGI